MCTLRCVWLFLEDPLAVPWPVAEPLGAQLGIDPSRVKRYTERLTTAYEHAWEIRYGYHAMSCPEWGTESRAVRMLALSLLVIAFDTTIVNVATPTFAVSLHVGATALEWITDAHTLVFAALLLPAGSLGDRYGRHLTLSAGMAVFGAGSLAAAMSTTATQLIVMRAVMGVGAAFLMPATSAVLMQVFADPAARAKAIGIWSAVSGLGVAIGPTAGGWLLAHYSWNAICAVNLPLVALALRGRFMSICVFLSSPDDVGAGGIRWSTCSGLLWWRGE